MQFAQKNFYKKLLGKVGEKKTCAYLKENGFKILETNYKTHFGEIDIIALDNETVVFIEVKTRVDNSFSEPCEAVDKRKQQKYYIVAKEFLVKNGLLDSPCRFDVVEIENDKINHIINAFSM